MKKKSLSPQFPVVKNSSVLSTNTCYPEYEDNSITKILSK